MTGEISSVNIISREILRVCVVFSSLAEIERPVEPLSEQGPAAPQGLAIFEDRIVAIEGAGKEFVRNSAPETARRGNRVQEFDVEGHGGKGYGEYLRMKRSKKHN